MARISRKNQKVFAGQAAADQIAVFGSMKTGTPVYSSDLDSLQSAEYEEGWADAILADKAPYLEEMNGVQYGLSSQIAYILQQGLAVEYDAATTYYKGSVVAVISGTDITFYKSITDNNTGNPVSDTANWQLDSLSKIESYHTELDNKIKSAADGQWVLLNQSVHNGSLAAASETPLPKTVNVPNDNRIYDVLFSAVVETGSTSGNAIYVNMRGNVLNAVFQVCGCRTRANNDVGSRGCALIPMKYASNNLYITRTATMAGTANITAVAYRRVGTNT